MSSSTERFLDLVPPALAAALGLLVASLAGCGGVPEPDAYGNFEATETTVSAQAEGRLVRFAVDEGDRLAAGALVGMVDTAQLAAQRDALLAQRQHLVGQQRALLVQARATRAQTAETDAGAAALAAQLQTAEEERARTERLFTDGAATARERNERDGAVRALRAQLRQARARTGTVSAQADVAQAQADALDGHLASLDAQLTGIADRLAKAGIENPVGGTVLSVVAEAGEVVQTGSPLYTVADLSTLKLHAFATGDQLPRLRLGMAAEVLVDDADGGLRSIPGTVTAIASDAQFTPTPIQTRDARAELVYAVDVRVPNPDGLLKVGMPGEVRFGDLSTASPPDPAP